MVGLACISKCVVCEKGRRTGMAASVDEKEREEEEGGRQEEAEQESCMHLN